MNFDNAASQLGPIVPSQWRCFAALESSNQHRFHVRLTILNWIASGLIPPHEFAHIIRDGCETSIGRQPLGPLENRLWDRDDHLRCSLSVIYRMHNGGQSEDRVAFSRFNLPACDTS